MAQDGDTLDSGSIGSPVMGIVGNSTPAVTRYFQLDSVGRIVLGSSSGVTLGTVDQGAHKTSGQGWRVTEYSTTGLPNFYFDIVGTWSIPACVIGDPVAGFPMGVLTNGGPAKMALRDASDAAHGVVANPIRVDPTGTTTQPVDTELPTAAALADATSNPTTTSVGALGLLYNGTTWDRIRGNTTALFAQGPAANDAAASGNPVQIGGVYRSTLNTVDDGDVGSLNIDDLQNLLTGVRRSTQVLTDINTTYNNTTTTATSAAFDVRKFRQGLFYAEVTVANTPTDLTFTLQMSHDNSNWYDYRVGPWVRYTFDDATVSAYGTMTICEPFMIAGSYIRMKVDAVGTTATLTFTVADAYFEVLD